MAYTYNKTEWHSGDPITQERMNNIEEGIANAAGLQSTIQTAQSTASNAATQANTNAGAIEQLQTDVGNLTTTVQQNASFGQEAMTQIHAATDSNETPYNNLDERFTAIENKQASEEALRQANSDAINNAKRTGMPNDTLSDRFGKVESDISTLTNGYNSLHQDLTNAGGYNESGVSQTLMTRLNNIDGSTTPTRTLPSVITEIQEAHGTNNTHGTLNNRFNTIEAELEDAHESTALGKTGNNKYNSIDARFEAIEEELVGTNAISSRIDTLAGNVDDLATHKISDTAIANNLTTDTAGKVLDARQGKALDEAKVNVLDIRDDLTHNESDKPLSAKQGKVLAERIDAIDNASTGTVAGLDTRVAALEAEVDMASNDGERRLDDIEGRIDDAESALNTLNGNASTTGSVLNTVNSRIAEVVDSAPEAFDTLKEIADWIGNNSDDALTMQTNISNNATAIEGLNTRLTAIDDATTGRMKAAEDDIDALETALGDANSGLTQRVGTLETTVGNASAGLVHDVDALEAAIGDANSGLVQRITALEGKDTIIVNAPAEGSNYTEGVPNIASPSANADYLIEDDEGKYFYWRYINDTWEMISGAGGGGTGSSSGEFAASLATIETPDENIDYFVGNSSIGYTHYRYIPPVEEGGEGTFVRILPKGLLTGAGVTANGGLEIYTIDDANNNLFSDFVAFKDVEATPVKDENDQVIATDLVFTNTNGQTITARVQGGGGGAAVSSYTMRLNNVLSSLKLTVPKKEGFNATISAKAVVKDAGVIDETFDQSHTIEATVQYSLNKNGPWTNYTTATIYNNTAFTVNVESILTLGVTTYIRVTAATMIEEEEKTSTLIYEVTQVEMSISAVNFNPATVRTTNFNFQYRCIGSGLTKQLHFLVDGSDIAGSPITTTLHNDIGQQNIPLTGLQPGMHSFQVYFTVDGIQSNILNYYILYNNDNTRQAPLVALAAEKDTITYGDDLKINYTVATIGTETTDEVVLELYTLDGSTEVPYASQTFVNVANETEQSWRPVEYPESGIAYVRATATHTINNVDYTDTRTIQITINALVLPAGYSLDPAGTDNLVYAYNAYGRTNNDSGKETFHYTYHALTGQDIEWTGAFNNFNWSGDGYVDGETLTISGGATHTVNVPIFQNAYNGITLENSEGVQDISKLGRTIEIEYEVESATNLNDVIIDCMANGAGFQVTPQSCYLLKSGSTVNMDSTGFILNESDIAAAYLTPGMRIHLAFVIEPWSDTLAYDNSYHQSVNIYVNGEFANACPYVQGTDSFASTATLRIGSSSCIIKLYQIKMYNCGLTHKQILQNYKVAPASTRDKLIRLDENDILNADGHVDYEKARTKYTCLLLTGPAPIVENGVVTNPTVSPYKGYPSPAHRKDKKTGEAVGKTESGVTLTKANPQVQQGYDVEFDLRDKVPTDQSIEVPAYIGDRGAYVSSNNVQGTSSQKYPLHNLKVYLAKWQGPQTTTSEVEVADGEDTTGLETITKTYKDVDGEWVEVEEGEDTTGLTTTTKTFKIVTTTTPAEIKKVKYSLKGKDEHGEDIGVAESTLCWKADYMSTDHANTFNANIADGLFTDVLPGASWGSKHQNTVYGIRCLLFQQQGNNAPEFLGDGCLNNDKGNNKTYDLERSGDEDADTASQKWELTNNSDDLGYFKTDTVFRTIGEGANAHIQAKDAFESTYPDEGDLKDANKEPNYNHLQILLTWLSKRANYWDETNPTTRAAKKQIFIDEFTDHFNMDHVLTYYLFSEYVALCDNRVKNMFLRSDNVKSENVYKISDGTAIFEGNSNPNADFFKAIDAVDTGTTQQVAIEDPETHEITYETQTIYKYELHNRDDIDWTNSTFAVWAPVLYDLDSCFGVENVGYLRVRYDANWDYTWNDAPQFNGYESRLWLQFADCFDNEIKAAALALYNRADGLNYTNFYRQQITGNLANISPALSNQDMLTKFDKPWSEGFMNYSLAEPAMETPYYKYLQRGSRTAQKTAFMNMRSKLLSSKYGANEFTNDAIKFRTGVPVGQENLQDTKITVVANQVMYPGVAYGDNKAPTRATANGGKVNAGQSCDIYAASPVQGNDGIFICGASVLTDIGDLSAFRPYQIDVGAGVNLKRLIVGSNAAGYTNGNTDTLMNLNKCVLLEEINVRNCTNVATLDLQNNPLIKKVYAAGSGATTLIFPNGGVLNTVEYSAVTGNITLRNQKSLVNFTYEDSATNHYSALTKLWIENTPNVPIVEIINTRMGGLTAGVRLTGIDIDLFEGASSQAELDAALETTTQFLNTLVSDLAKGKYLDNAGAFTPGNTQYPYIQGKVHVTSIRNSLLAKLNQLYPNLIVYNTIDSDGTVGNNIITEYTITYINYDGTLLYTDYRTGRENFIDPTSLDPRDIDPITNDRRIPIPTKPEDEQYKYTFGSYEDGEYIRYSGWVKQYTTTNPLDDDYPQGNTTFVAVYPTTQIQRYTVNWYEEPAGAVIKSYTANYGVDISGYTQPEEDGSINRIKIDGNNIKVFKGWDRPVGKLTGNTNVYAQWEVSSIDNGVQASDIVMENLTAADLAAIARLGSEAKQRILEDKLGNSPIMVQMGHDFNYTSGVTAYDLLNGASKLTFNSQTSDAKIFDGEHAGLPNIRPLYVNSDWTLAIDYKFLMTQALYSNGTEWVLASCYSNADSTIQGFKLSLVKNNTANSIEQYIRLTWGTSTVNLDYLTIDRAAANNKQYSRSYRNMLVLRHKASEPTILYAYYMAPSLANTDAPYGSNISTTLSNTTLTWANNNSLNMPLVLGNTDSTTTNRPAKAIIYWAKFWDKDLGDKNCNALASWPHEKIPFFLSGYDNNDSPTRQILENTNLTFVAAQAVGDRYAYPLRSQLTPVNNYFGWRDTDERKICNNRIYKGLSTAFQSIVLQSSINAVHTYTADSNGEANAALITTADYFYLPAEGEVNSETLSNGLKEQEVSAAWYSTNSAWPWMQVSNIHNWFVNNTGTTLELATADNITPFLFRFIGNYIKPTAKIFVINRDPYNSGNTWTYNNAETAVASGDVWLNDGIAYIYYTNAEINEGIYVDIVNDGGGWKKADIWHLRTYNLGQNTAYENLLEKVEDNGNIMTTPGNSYRRTEGRILCPEFSI